MCYLFLNLISYLCRRKSAVEEILRVLEPGGKFLIYVWAKDQRKEELSSYLKQNKKNLKPNNITDKNKQGS